ncbi:MAG: MBL fold metallo-hydrolase [Bacteroides sp.]|nr:MBL fold metallo-hydrolase [Prevotella sp.]MCM1407893.1 MBL fold metallo-hydrolase [Treponema brennaborense]MCM1469635.1 MBL fold metallo-hydrolase [Bacteroides sp.]
MKITFWGVRGSLPTPLAPEQVRLKIQAVVQRITAKDLKSPDTRESFLLNLPEWLYGTVGGNSACVELESDTGELVILDAGSGLKQLGQKYRHRTDAFHIVFSHFHWDHIQGLPFFEPLFKNHADIHFYSPVGGMRKYLEQQMTFPYFPVPMENGGQKIHFHTLEPDAVFSIGNMSARIKKMAHPGGVYAYAFFENGKHFVYATDVELCADDFAETEENSRFFAGADVLVLDSQYTLADAVEKEHWGHSAFSHAIDFAAFWNIKSIYLFHHEPTYDDKKLHGILQSARWYSEYQKKADLKIFMAAEGREIVL